MLNLHSLIMFMNAVEVLHKLACCPNFQCESQYSSLSNNSSESAADSIIYSQGSALLAGQFLSISLR